MKIFALALITVTMSCQNLTQRQDVQTILTEESFNQDFSISDSTLTIPQSVLGYVAKNFEGWTVPDTSNYIKAWWSFYDHSNIPYFVAVDINDDIHLDYGLLLKSDNALKAIILICSPDSMHHFTVEGFNPPFNGSDIMYGLDIIAPDRIDIIFPQEASLILKSNGISLNNFEIKEKIFYWADGGINTFDLK
jgi:hypothetical protein